MHTMPMAISHAFTRWFGLVYTEARTVQLEGTEKRVEFSIAAKRLEWRSCKARDQKVIFCVEVVAGWFGKAGLAGWFGKAGLDWFA